MARLTVNVLSAFAPTLTVDGTETVTAPFVASFGEAER